MVGMCYRIFGVKVQRDVYQPIWVRSSIIKIVYIADQPMIYKMLFNCIAKKMLVHMSKIWIIAGLDDD